MCNSFYFEQKLKGNNKDGIWQKRVTVSEREAGTSHSGNLISDAVEAALLKARMEKENKFTDDQQTSGKNKKKRDRNPFLYVLWEWYIHIVKYLFMNMCIYVCFYFTYYLLLSFLKIS